jgi:hypothetical protein
VSPRLSQWQVKSHFKSVFSKGLVKMSATMSDVGIHTIEKSSLAIQYVHE